MVLPFDFTEIFNIFGIRALFSVFKNSRKILKKLRTIYFLKKKKYFQENHRVRISTILYQTSPSFLFLKKFKHNFMDTVNPMSPTNDGIEETQHCLLLYFSFDNQRRDLLAGVSNCYDNLSELTPFQTKLWFNTYGLAIKNFLMT